MIIEKQDCAFWRGGQCNGCEEHCRYSHPEQEIPFTMETIAPKEPIVAVAKYSYPYGPHCDENS